MSQRWNDTTSEFESCDKLAKGVVEKTGSSHKVGSRRRLKLHGQRWRWRWIWSRRRNPEAGNELSTLQLFRKLLAAEFSGITSSFRFYILNFFLFSFFSNFSCSESCTGFAPAFTAGWDPWPWSSAIWIRGIPTSCLFNWSTLHEIKILFKILKTEGRLYGVGFESREYASRSLFEPL